MAKKESPEGGAKPKAERQSKLVPGTFTDHDQKFKVLIANFLEEFLTLFLPEIAGQFDCRRAEWVRQERYIHPPSGEVLAVDMAAKLPYKFRDGERLVLIHIEFESGDSSAGFGQRMHNYFADLLDEGLPILPIALFTEMVGEGAEWVTFAWPFDTIEVLTFRYFSISLAGLEALPYLRGTNPLGYALAALMRFPTGEVGPGLVAEAMAKIEASGLDNARQALLADCALTYWPRGAENLQKVEERLEALARKREGDVNRPTLYQAWQELYGDRFRKEGFQQGTIRSIVRLLTKRLGTIPPSFAESLAGRDEAELDRIFDQADTITDLDQLELLRVGFNRGNSSDVTSDQPDG